MSHKPLPDKQPYHLAVENAYRSQTLQVECDKSQECLHTNDYQRDIYTSHYYSDNDYAKWKQATGQ